MKYISPRAPAQDSWSINAALDWLSYAFANQKQVFEASVGFHNDALHVIAGVALQLAAAILLRSSLDRMGPWLLVLVLELANEANDFLVEVWPESAASRQMGEGIKDVLLTMALPTLLLLVARYRSGIIAGRDVQADKSAQP